MHEKMKGEKIAVKYTGKEQRCQVSDISNLSTS